MRVEVLGPCPQPLSREQFGDIVFNNRCRLLKFASQQLNMEETSATAAGIVHPSLKTDSELLTGTRTWISPLLPRLWAKNRLRLSLDYVRFKTRGQDECSVPIYLQHREVYVEMVENHLLASVRGNRLSGCEWKSGCGNLLRMGYA